MRTIGLIGRRPHLRIAVGIVAFEAAFDFVAAAGLAIEAYFQPLPAAGGDFFQQPRHLVQLTGADDQIDVRRPLEDQLLILLCHAAQHADDLMRVAIFGVLQPSQGAVDFVFGMLPHAAGVEQDRVGLGGRVDQFVALLAQRRHHQLAIEHVHLAADGFDVQTLGHGDQRLSKLA